MPKAAARLPAEPQKCLLGANIYVSSLVKRRAKYGNHDKYQAVMARGWYKVQGEPCDEMALKLCVMAGAILYEALALARNVVR